MIQEFTIYGERCSGTNYLEQLVLNNFNATVTWRYGWKHFFGFQEKELEDSDATLFICIVRDPIKWINSFYRELHHSPLKYSNIANQNKKLDIFLNKEFWSVCNPQPDGDHNLEEKMIDRNIYTGERYKNIFEMRHTKIKYLLEDLPKKVKHHIFIRYEDLMSDFDNTMNKIKDKGLRVKDGVKFPLNTTQYKAHKNIKFDKKKNRDTIPITFIINNPNLIKFYEYQLGYISNTEKKSMICNLNNIKNVIKNEGVNLLVVSYGGSCSNILISTLINNGYKCITKTYSEILCHCPHYIEIDIPIIYIYDNPIKAFMSMKNRGNGFWNVNQQKLSNNKNVVLSDENLIKLMIDQFNSWTNIKRDNILVIKSCELFNDSIVNKLENFLRKKNLRDFPIVFVKPKTDILNIKDVKLIELFEKYRLEIDTITGYTSL